MTRLFLLAFLVAFPFAARAQLIDQVEVVGAGAEAEIRIQLTVPVQVLRHFPQAEGTALSIALELLGPLDGPGSRTLAESRTPPTHGLVPRFTVSYPQPDSTLGVRFDTRVRFRVRQGADPRTILVYVATGRQPQALPQPAPVAPSAAPAPSEVEKAAAVLLREGKEALQHNDPRAATDAFNRLLILPPNAASREAQELIGLARERNGEIRKARVEYELFLKLYPQGEDAKRVAARLAALPAAAAARLPAARAALRPETAETTTYGSLSQYYYRGFTKFDATLAPPTPGLKFDQISLTSTDQSALVSSLDLTRRTRAPEADSKLVFRDIFTQNFLSGQSDENRVYALYYERQSADASWLGRIGRQPGFTGGVLGRFDGVWGGYALRPGLRVNAVLGAPVEFYTAQSKRFFGLNADVGPIAERWSANVFVIEQQSEGVLDRRAVGGEARYFDAKSNVFGLIDYDVSFRALNIAMLQASHVTDSQTTWTLLFDHRRVPVLQTTNVLVAETATIPGTPIPTLAELTEAGRNLAELQAGAKALTPVSDLVLVGFIRPVGRKLQLGADFRVSEVSGTEASGNLPAAPGTGKVYVYSGLAIKTGLLGSSDTGVANVSLIDGTTYNGTALALTYVYPIDRWRLETALRFYRQRDVLGVKLARFSPTLRASYRLKERANLEAEIGAENTDTEGPMQQERTRRQFFSLGYRWDF